MSMTENEILKHLETSLYQSCMHSFIQLKKIYPEDVSMNKIKKTLDGNLQNLNITINKEDSLSSGLSSLLSNKEKEYQKALLEKQDTDILEDDVYYLQKSIEILGRDSIGNT